MLLGRQIVKFRLTKLKKRTARRNSSGSSDSAEKSRDLHYGRYCRYLVYITENNVSPETTSANYALVEHHVNKTRC